MYNPEYDTKLEKLERASESRHHRATENTALAVAFVALDAIAGVLGSRDLPPLTSAVGTCVEYSYTLFTIAVLRWQTGVVKNGWQRYGQIKKQLCTEKQLLIEHVPLSPAELIHGKGVWYSDTKIAP